MHRAARHEVALEVADVARIFRYCRACWTGRWAIFPAAKKAGSRWPGHWYRRPDFLLLDEPFAALDGIRRRTFIATLLDMHKVYKLPMLVVTHNIDDAAALASYLVAIRDGAVVVSGDFAVASREAAFQSLLDARDTGAAIPSQLLQAASDNRRGAIWLRADQVLLATEPPRSLSARNVLEGRVSALRNEGDHSVLVEVSTPVGTLLSRITPQAAAELHLAPECPVWAIAKAHLL